MNHDFATGVLVGVACGVGCLVLGLVLKSGILLYAAPVAFFIPTLLQIIVAMSRHQKVVSRSRKPTAAPKTNEDTITPIKDFLMSEINKVAMPKFGRLFNLPVLAGVIFVVCMVMGGWYTVNQGDRAVVLRFGKTIAVTDPGLHFKLPFIDSVNKISVRTRKYTRNINIYSKDIQGAEIVFSLNYSLNPSKVGDIYGQYGLVYEERIILPQVMAKPKDVFGKYNAVDIVQNREKLTAEILAEFGKQFEGSGIIAESVQIENIDFSDEYERSVEERMKAEVEVQKVRQNLEREKLNADMVRTKAQGAADAVVMAADSEAKAIKMRGDAEASAINAKAKALGQNPELVKLIQAEKWNGALPSTMLPNGTLPIINTK